VDERLRTSDPDIYAVGDVAEFAGGVGNLVAAWNRRLSRPPRFSAKRERSIDRPSPARRSRSRAGPYEPRFSAGRFSGKAYARVSADGCRYEKYVVADDGTLSGAILLGSKERARAMTSRMGKQSNSPKSTVALVLSSINCPKRSQHLFGQQSLVHVENFDHLVAGGRFVRVGVHEIFHHVPPFLDDGKLRELPVRRVVSQVLTAKRVFVLRSRYIE